MTTLALEFSSDRRSAAVARDGVVLSEACVMGGRVTSAPALMASALRDAGVEAGAVERLALGIGPGSYTGIRRAVATLQGWHLARGTPVVVVGSFEILARVAHEAGMDDVLLAADAQRGEWAVTGASSGRADPALSLVSLQELGDRIRSGARVVTPDPALPGATRLYPTAALAALMAEGREVADPTRLAPVYLREAVFVKAPPPRAGLG